MVKEPKQKTVSWYINETLRTIEPGTKFTSADLKGWLPIESQPISNGAFSGSVHAQSLSGSIRRIGQDQYEMLVPPTTSKKFKSRPVRKTKADWAGEAVEASSAVVPQPSTASLSSRLLDLAASAEGLERNALANATEEQLWAELMKRRS